jgi:hypothetical protein
MALVVPSKRAPVKALAFMRRAAAGDSDIGDAFDKRPLDLHP